MLSGLRDYQRKNTLELMAMVQRRVPAFLYYLPTAGGKTTVFVRLALLLMQQLNFNIVIFVHRKELLWQTQRTLKNLGIDAGVIAPGYQPTSHKIHVASIDTVGSRLGSLKDFLSTIDFAIFDEAHHIVASSWGRVLAALSNALILGVSATPWRQDGKPLGSVFVDVVRGPTKAQLIKWGYIAPSVVFAPELNVDLTGITKRGGDFARGELARAMDHEELITPVVKAYSKFCPGVPTITFCAGVDHAFNVSEAFKRAGWMSTNLDGRMSPQEREKAINGLGCGNYQNLTSCDIVSEGTDIPIVGAALHLRPTQSTALYDQQNGRTFRLYEGKEHSTIVDFVGNWTVHGLPETDRQWSLRDGLISIDVNNSELKRCPRCFRVHHVADTCPSCGRVHQKRNSQFTPLSDKELRGMPGIRQHSALKIKEMKFQTLMQIGETEKDFQRIAKIKGFRPEWVAEVMQRKHDMKRAGRRGRY
ncbi:DEAD/DEAH box helicase [Terasakiella pusilla]|uniref:DEAD/DEAH box helicase n=1 Tax=Terasakiella pusilla TaxID=64973 RepID=UPI003AA85E9E